MLKSYIDYGLFLIDEFRVHVVVNIFSVFGVYPEELTDKKEMCSLLSKLRPVTFGGELIRQGPDVDGGYLVPDDLNGIKACFSPGVDRASGFELDCAEMGMDIFMADYSVEVPAESHINFHFTKKYLGSFTNDMYMTLDHWVIKHIPCEDEELLLQMDIEGAEYEVILNATENLLKRFRIIVIEFHDLDKLWNQSYFNIANKVFEKLLQTHAVVHNHPNNCASAIKMKGLEIPRLSELTFLRKDRVHHPEFVKNFPHPLDRDNTTNHPLPLPECWYI